MLRQTWRQRSFWKTQPHACERVETHAIIASGSELAMTTPWPLFQPEPHLEGVIGGLKHSAAEVGGIGEGGFTVAFGRSNHMLMIHHANVLHSSRGGKNLTLVRAPASMPWPVYTRKAGSRSEPDATATWAWTEPDNCPSFFQYSSPACNSVKIPPKQSNTILKPSTQHKSTPA